LADGVRFHRRGNGECALVADDDHFMGLGAV
jgi:hypothetical protein